MDFMLRNTRDNYGSVAKFFHWLMALAVIFMLALGLYMSGLSFSPDKLRLYGLHKSIGALILIFVTLRLIWRFTNPAPVLPEGLSAFEKFAASAVHYMLYSIMFLMPLTGWLMSSATGFPVSVFGFFTLPDLIKPDKALQHFFATAHNYIAYAAIGLISLHILAALKHHFIDKDNILRRMLPWVRS